MLLSLRRRKMAGPTLPSRLAGATEDWRRVGANFLARLEKRRIRPPLLELLVVL